MQHSRPASTFLLVLPKGHSQCNLEVGQHVYVNIKSDVSGQSLSHNGRGAFVGGHRGPRSFSWSTLHGDLAQEYGAVSFAEQRMPGIAAEPPGAMSHLPSLSTGSVRVIAGGEDVKPVVLQLIGTVATSLTDDHFLGDGCRGSSTPLHHTAS